VVVANTVPVLLDVEVVVDRSYVVLVVVPVAVVLVLLVENAVSVDREVDAEVDTTVGTCLVHM